MSAAVVARERAAAKTRRPVKPSTIAEVAGFRPTNQSEASPEPMPMAWPQSMFRGLAVGTSGVKSSMNAVGPTEGNAKGVWETSAKPAGMATDAKLLTNTKDAHTRRGASFCEPVRKAKPFQSADVRLHAGTCKATLQTRVNRHPWPGSCRPAVAHQ